MRILRVPLLMTLLCGVSTLSHAAPIIDGDNTVLRNGVGRTNGGEFNLFVNSPPSFPNFYLERTDSLMSFERGRVGRVKEIAPEAPSSKATKISEEAATNPFVSSEQSTVVVQVPGPASLIVAVSGLLALTLVRRRRALRQT